MRSYSTEDHPVLAQIWRDAWASANPHIVDIAPLDHWLSRIHNEFAPPNLTLVHECAGQITAFLVLDAEEAYLHQLFVAPSAQGRGIGGELLERVCELCPSGWSLHVATDNTRAQQFYVHHGLTRGSESVNPVTHRKRVAYEWRPLDWSTGIITHGGGVDETISQLCRTRERATDSARRDAAVRVRNSMKPEFRELGANEIMAFIRGDAADPKP